MPFWAEQISLLKIKCLNLHVLRQGVAFDIIKLLMSENISMDFNGKF